jgi:competence protein ComEC
MRKLLVVAVVIMLSLSTIVGVLLIYQPGPEDGKDSEDRITVDTHLLSVHFIDVGQGDATLIMAPSGARILIDAGPLESEEVLLSYLESYNVTHLDALVVSHSDSDHCGSADDVLRALDVDLVVHSGFYKDTPAYADFLEAVEEEGCPVLTRDTLDEGQYLDLADDLTVQVLSAYREAHDSNSASIVLKITYGSEDLLFMGDAPSGVEDWTMRNYDIDAEVLKVAHHGSYSSTSQEFLAEATPRYAVIFCAAGNDYGYPHDEVLDRLGSVGAEVCRTDISGSIVLQTNGTAMERLI